MLLCYHTALLSHCSAITLLQEQYYNEPGSVVEVDLYHAETLLPLSDEDIIDKVSCWALGTVQH